MPIKDMTAESGELLRNIQQRQEILTELSNYLSQLESQLSLIFSASPDLILFMDTDGEIQKASAAAFKILGYTPHELIGKKIHSLLINPEGETNKILRDVLELKILNFSFDEMVFTKMRSKTGATVRLAWRFCVLDERSGQIIGFATDISALEVDSPRSLKLIQKAIEKSREGIVITDNTQEDNPMVYVNNAFCQVTGFNKEELIGKNCRMLQSEEGRGSKSIEYLRNAIDNGDSFDCLLKNFRKDGTVFYNHLTIVPIHENGNTVNFIGLARDVTKEVGVLYNWSSETPTGFALI